MHERYEAKIDVLTTAQRRVIQLLAEGKSNAEIGAILFVSKRTLEHHIRDSFDKIGLPVGEGNRRVLAALWYLRATGRLRDET